MFSDIFRLVYLCTGEKKWKPGMILGIAEIHRKLIKPGKQIRRLQNCDNNWNKWLSSM